MKLSPEVLLEIMSIVQSGLLHQTDVSESLRELDLSIDEDSLLLVLSDEYKSIFKE